MHPAQSRNLEPSTRLEPTSQDVLPDTVRDLIGQFGRRRLQGEFASLENDRTFYHTVAYRLRMIKESKKYIFLEKISFMDQSLSIEVLGR